MNIKAVPYLLDSAKSAVVDLVSTGNKEERRQALGIRKVMERNQASYIQAGKVRRNHDVRVFMATRKKLFNRGEKLKPKKITQYDYDFFLALVDETEKKEKKLLLLTEGLAKTIKQNIPDDVSDEDILKRYSDLTEGLDLQSTTLIMLFLKYYWCSKTLGYFAEISNLNKKQQAIFSNGLDDISKRMNDDLSKISFIATVDDKEFKAFQKILGLPSNFKEGRFIKMESYLQKKINQTVTLIVLSMSEEMNIEDI